MKLSDLFVLDSLKFSKKRKAFEKLLVKLDRTHERLEQDIRVSRSDTERRRLEIKLKTNRRHREKTRNLIASLDLSGQPNGRQSVSICRLF